MKLYLTIQQWAPVPILYFFGLYAKESMLYICTRFSVLSIAHEFIFPHLYLQNNFFIKNRRKIHPGESIPEVQVASSEPYLCGINSAAIEKCVGSIYYTEKKLSK